jgi:hypothetical protein
MNTNIIVCCLFGACADVAPRGREVDVFQAPAQQERPPHGERRSRDEVAGGPAEAERPAQRRHWDDPGAGPSHAPPAAAGADEDVVRRFETVLRDVPEGMWRHIQDEELLEQCVGLFPPWRSIMRRAAVLAAMTSGRLPPGQGDPADVPPPPPGAGRGGPPPPPEGGAAGGALEAP